MLHNITILDYAILPFVLFIIYFIAIRYRNKHYGFSHPYRKYFIPALTLKIIGAIFIGMIYEYYYGGGGDTMNYFLHAKIINSSFSDSPLKWLHLIFRTTNGSTIGYYQYISRMEWYADPASYTVSVIAAFIGIFVGTAYLPITVIFAAISFTGIWAMFRAFAAIYPNLVKPIATAVLFIPSVIVWGSGIFKDTICLFALGWLTYGTFQLLVKRKFSGQNWALSILSLLLVARIKIYILLAFVPALLLWILFIYTQSVQNAAFRFLIRLCVVVIAMGGSFFMMQQLGEDQLGRYSLNNIEGTVQETRNWIIYSSGQEGSAYDLGAINNPKDMLIKFPLAINATLFRPYLWEAGKIIIFFSALESLLFLFLTIKILIKVGIKKTWQTVISDPTIQFCLLFAFIFAGAVGISSGNFGTLSRYKIPCLPFYAVAMLLIYYKNFPVRNNLLKPLNI